MIDVDKTTFEEEVLKAEGYVFVDFYGDGCVPCQALMPKVHEFADTYGDKLKFTSLNTTKARRLYRLPLQEVQELSGQSIKTGKK